MQEEYSTTGMHQGDKWRDFSKLRKCNNYLTDLDFKYGILHGAAQKIITSPGGYMLRADKWFCSWRLTRAGRASSVRCTLQLLCKVHVTKNNCCTALQNS